MRKLPVYLLLNISSSMKCEPIEAIKKGIDSMIVSLQKKPQTIECVHTFNTTEPQVNAPLTELEVFQLIDLVVSGQTALGIGLQLLTDKISSEVVETTLEQNGDWKPIVFIITDGAPIDDWRKGLDYFSTCKTTFTEVCAVGSHTDITLLKEISPNVINLEKTDEDSMSRFFLWVSSSISSLSNQIVVEGNITSLDMDMLPPLPPEINIIR